MRRLLLLMIVTLGLAPGTWLRSEPTPRDRDSRQILAITPIPARVGDLGGLRVAGAWELGSRNRHFGGYSAMVVLDDGSLLAGSDRGRVLHFMPPGRDAQSSRLPRFGFFAGRRAWDKGSVDLEALTRDPDTGRVWAAYENANRVDRHDAQFRAVASVRPETMRHWPDNAGPEAMVRLRDGRFVVLAEADSRWLVDSTPGLLFPDDPVEGAEPLAFTFVPPASFRPVDMAELPDGRVLILLRKVGLGLPPRFSSRLVVADPADIVEGRPWRSERVADLAAPLPADNYEGLAVERVGDDAVLWLISDDNSMQFQRTLLLRLEWRGYAKTHGPGRAPR